MYIEPKAKPGEEFISGLQKLKTAHNVLSQLPHLPISNARVKLEKSILLFLITGLDVHTSSVTDIVTTVNSRINLMVQRLERFLDVNKEGPELSDLENEMWGLLQDLSVILAGVKRM